MNRIFTIGREFGSGGREFGRRLAEELNIEYYDKEIITEITKRTSLSEQYVNEVIERKPHSLYPIAVGHTISYFNNYQISQLQTLYSAQCEIITDLAKRSDCVIIGRCADYILRDMKPYRIFIYADIESRIKRCMERSSAGEHYTEKEMKKHILRVDKERAKFYEYFTDSKWGEWKNYDLCINTTNTVIKEIVPLIAKMFN